MSDCALSIIIPAFNEAGVIGGILDRIHALGLERYEIIVVDDGSTDDTGDAARRCGARVIRHPYNIGNGAAVKTGLRNARGDLVVMMDGDGQHPPEDIPRLLEALGEYHMVVAARDFGTSGSWHRNIANRAYNSFASYVAQFRIADLTSGFRAMRRLDAIRFIDLLPNTFSYPTTITLSFLRSGLAVKYVTTTFPKRVGKSKIRIFDDGIRFLLIISKIATLFSPFRVFVPVSLALFLTGVSYYAYTYFMYNRLTNMVAILFTTAVVIFMMGLVSEQIAMLRMERLTSLLPVTDERGEGETGVDESRRTIRLVAGDRDS